MFFCDLILTIPNKIAEVLDDVPALLQSLLTPFAPTDLFEIILKFYFYVNVCGIFYDFNYIDFSVMTVDYILTLTIVVLIVLSYFLDVKTKGPHIGPLPSQH